MLADVNASLRLPRMPREYMSGIVILTVRVINKLEKFVKVEMSTFAAFQQAASVMAVVQICFSRLQKLINVFQPLIAP